MHETLQNLQQANLQLVTSFTDNSNWQTLRPLCRTIMAELTTSSVDTTPISPVERRNSLEKHLQTRPDPKDLKGRHILLDTNAAP